MGTGHPLASRKSRVNRATWRCTETLTASRPIYRIEVEQDIAAIEVIMTQG